MASSSHVRRPGDLQSGVPAGDPTHRAAVYRAWSVGGIFVWVWTLVRTSPLKAKPLAGGSLTVFLTGATGYVGRRLAVELLRRGHSVIALARKGSESRTPAGCTV